MPDVSVVVDSWSANVPGEAEAAGHEAPPPVSSVQAQDVSKPVLHRTALVDNDAQNNMLSANQINIKRKQGVIGKRKAKGKTKHTKQGANLQKCLNLRTDVLKVKTNFANDTHPKVSQPQYRCFNSKNQLCKRYQFMFLHWLYKDH